MANVPASMEKYIDVVQTNRDGSVILGASGLSGRYWQGSLWYYDKLLGRTEEIGREQSCVPKVEKCRSGVETEAGVTDIQWISDTRVAVASDSGAIEVWEIVDNGSAFKNLFYLYEHDSIVYSIGLNLERKLAASGSQDSSIKIWDFERQSSVSTYRVHTNAVTCVKWSSSQVTSFLSCSQDGNVILFDTRNPMPGILLEKSPLTATPTYVAWKPFSQYIYAVGDETGHIVMKDVRSNVGNVLELQAHKNAIHRLGFSPVSPNWLASISDDCTVLVCDMTEDQVQKMYRDRRHNDFVRGLSWSQTERSLYTSGWDQKVLLHDPAIASTPSTNTANLPMDYEVGGKSKLVHV